MKHITSIILFLLLFLGLSCTNNKDIALSLDTAEALMQTQPDSALKILQSLDGRQMPRGALQARYALLYTQATDKNYLPIPGDSLIQIAVDYYSRKKDYQRLGWAYYYQGSAYAQMDSIQLAMTCFLHTQELLLSVQDDYLLGLVTNAIAVLYQAQRNYEQALSLFRLSLSAFERLGDVKNKGHVLSQVADVFFLSKQPTDSIHYYYNQAKRFAIEQSDLNLLYLVSVSQAAVLRRQGEFARAKQLLFETIHSYIKETVPVECYPLISMLCLDLHQIDSARHYMLLVLEAPQATAKQRTGALAGMQMIEESAGDLQAALNYAKRYKELSDSILLANHENNIQGIEQKILLEKQKSEHLKQKIRFSLTIICVIALCINAIFLINRWWKKRVARRENRILAKYKALEELASTSLIKNWNMSLFQREVESGSPYRTQEAFISKVFASAKTAYPGLHEWIEKYHPELNQANRMLFCLFFSQWKSSEICNMCPIFNIGSLNTRRSRLYRDLDLKIDPKTPPSFRKLFLDSGVYNKM